MLYVLWRNQNHIYCLTDAVKIHVDVSRQTASVIFATLHHEQIHVAVRSHLPADSRAKKNNLLRRGHLYDAPNNLAQLSSVYCRFAAHVLASNESYPIIASFTTREVECGCLPMTLSLQRGHDETVCHNLFAAGLSKEDRIAIGYRLLFIE